MRHALLAASLLLLGCEPAPAVRSYAVPRDGGVARPAPSAPVAPSPGQPAMQASPEMVAAAAKEGQPAFPAAPAGWSAKDPGAMRKGSWSIGPADAAADLAVTVFPGDVGGRVANFNRWRQQLGLPPAPAGAFDAVQPAKVGDLEGEVVQFASADGATATRAVLVAHKGSTWFFKMTGPGPTVQAAAAAFDAFVAGTRLP
jgi:hypothetical protein